MPEGEESKDTCNDNQRVAREKDIVYGPTIVLNKYFSGLSAELIIN